MNEGGREGVEEEESNGKRRGRMNRIGCGNE